MLRLSAVVLAVVMGAGSALAGCGQTGEPARGSATDEAEWRGTLLPEPWAKPSFTLTDANGQPFDLRASTDGYLTLLFFGYTNCPDVCPLHMANLSAVLDQVSGDVRANTKVVFATTDPARDTPARLRSWLAGFDPSFVGLTGSVDEVRAAQEATGVAVAGFEPPEDDGSYVVGHAAQVIAYTRDGLAHIVYPFGTRQDDWAEDLPRLLEEPAWNP